MNPPSLPSRARLQAARPQAHAAYISEACHQGHGFTPGFYTKDTQLGGVFGYVATNKCLPPIASSITSSPAPVKSISQLAVETL